MLNIGGALSPTCNIGGGRCPPLVILGGGGALSPTCNIGGGALSPTCNIGGGGALSPTCNIGRGHSPPAPLEINILYLGYFFSKNLIILLLSWDCCG